MAVVAVVAVWVVWMVLAISAAFLAPGVQVATSFPQIFTPNTLMAQEIERLKEITGSDLNPLEIVIQPADIHGQPLDQLGSAALFTSNYLKTISETRVALPLGILGEQGREKILQHRRSIVRTTVGAVVCSTVRAAIGTTIRSAVAVAAIVVIATAVAA